MSSRQSRQSAHPRKKARQSSTLSFSRAFTRATPLLLLVIVLRQSAVSVRGQYLPPAHNVRGIGEGLPRPGGGNLSTPTPTSTSTLRGKMELERDSSIHGGIVNTRVNAKRDSQTSTSTVIYLVSHDDFCLFGPPDPFQYIWETGLDVVSWCSQSGHGTRLIPDGTLHGVTYVKTPDWVQVSGTGDFTKLNIAPGDQGGQFDSSSNTPSGATMYVSDDSDTASSWVTMISATTFCVRACTGDASYCPTDYDEMGCWFLTSDGVGWDGVWQDCEGDDGDPPGVVDGTTYTQGATPVPDFTAPAVTNCQQGSSVSNGQTAPPDYTWTGASAASATSTSTSSSSSDDDDDDDADSSTASTSWVAVETCVPCTTTAAAGSSGVSSSASSSVGGTEQIGVTQLSGESTVSATTTAVSASSTSSSSESGASENGVLDVEVTSESNSASGTITSAATSAATSSYASSGENGSEDLIDKRDHKRGWLRRDDDGTTTSDGQCCFTTWTASVIGGSSATSTSGAGSSDTGSGVSTAISGSSSEGSSATGSGTKSSSASSGTATTKTTSNVGVSSVKSSTGTATASGTVKSGNSSTTTSGSNSTSSNGTNGTSSALGRVDIVPIALGKNGMISLWTFGLTMLGWMAMGGMVLV